MGKKIKEWVAYNQDVFVLNIILAIKVLIFSFRYSLAPSLVWPATTTLALVFILTSWTVVLPALLRQSALLLLDVCITVILIADAIFMRFFQRALPVLAFYQLDQLSGISSSIANLFTLQDFLFGLDLFFIVPYLAYVFTKQKLQSVNLGFKFAQVALVLGLCTGVLYAKVNNIISIHGPEVISNISMNNTLLNEMGVLNFHLADLYNTFSTNESTTLAKNDILAVRAWNEVYQFESNFEGAALGKNLIIIQVESLQNFLINRSVNGQEVTPNLNKLLKSSLYFDNYFAQIAQGNSADAEFMTFNSLYPPPIGASLLMYPKNDYISLPALLKERGYNTFVIHGDVPTFWGRDVAYPAMGIDKFISRNELKPGSVIGMGLSDKEVFEQAIPIIEQANMPFMSMIITLSGHHPFVIPESEKELNIAPDEYSQIFSDYLQAQHYADKQIGASLDALEKDGILDNSLLVVYGDHFGTGWTDADIQKFLSLSKPLNEYQRMEFKKVPLMIRLPKGQQVGIQHQSGGQMDLMPTIANLMGLEREKMICFGQDLLNEIDGFSIFRYYAADGSFATNNFMYLGSTDGVFEHGHAYDRKSGQEIKAEPLREKYNEAKEQLRVSDQLLEGNAILEIANESDQSF